MKVNFEVSLDSAIFTTSSANSFVPSLPLAQCEHSTALTPNLSQPSEITLPSASVSSVKLLMATITCSPKDFIFSICL